MTIGAMSRREYIVEVNKAADGHDFYSCVDCPLYNGEWGQCQAMQYFFPRSTPPDLWNTNRNRDGSYTDCTPDWCPLRESSITIRLGRHA